MSARRQFLLSLGIASALGCGSAGTDASELLVVATVEIDPPGASLVEESTLQLTAVAKTSSGITVPNRQVTWHSEDPVVASVSATGVVTGVTAGQTRIVATIDRRSGSIPLVVTPRPVASVGVSPDPATMLVGEAMQLVVTPRDAAGQPLDGRSVTFSSDNPAIASVSVTGVVIGVSPGQSMIRAQVEGKTGTATANVNPRPASRVAFLTEPANGAAGDALAPIRVEVENEIGGAVTVGTIPITLDLADNPGGATLSGTRTVNAVNGVATFPDLVLNRAAAGYSLRASSGSLSPALSGSFAIAPGTPAALALATQPSASGASGASLAQQPVVRAQDAFGNTVAAAGLQVTAALLGAGATLGGATTVTTDASGVATFTNLVLTGAAGTYGLLFAAPNLTAVASSAITLGAGVAARLAIVQQPAPGAQSGKPFPQQPVLQIQDANGNPAPKANEPVTVEIATGGGTLGGTTTVFTDANGRAAFSDLFISGSVGTHTLRFSSGAITPVLSGDIQLTAGPGVALFVVRQPPTAATSGVALSPEPVVRVVDAFGNSADLVGEISITASLASGPGTLGGTTLAVTVGGVATFPGLVLTGPAGQYTLRFSNPAFSPATSNPISVGAASPTALVITTKPSTTVTSGQVLPRQPVVELRDGSGNAVAKAGVPVTATLVGCGGVLGGTTTVITNSGGLASFTDLSIGGGAGTCNLLFAAPGLSSATSDPITIISAGAASLVITTQPSTAAESGTAFGQQPVVALTDPDGKPVSGAVVTATINSGPGGSPVLANATATTDAGGVATFSGLAITGAPGSYSLQFASGVVSAVSSTVALTGPAVQLLLATPPGATAQSGSPLTTQPAVQVSDAAGNPIGGGGVTVTAVLDSGDPSATLSGTSAATDASGRATFGSLSITGPAGSYTLRFESAPLTPVTSGTIALSAGSPAALTFSTQPPASAVNGAQLSNTTIEVRDGGGSVVSGVAVTVALGTGLDTGTLSGTTTVNTNSSGRATFTDLVITGLVGPYTLVGSASGAAPVTSRVITLSAGSAAKLGMHTEPSATASSGSHLEVQPQVDLRDSGGNLVDTDGVRISVTLETVTGGGFLGGSSSHNTNNGVSTWTNLRITGNGTFRLRFTANGLTSVSSRVISVQ